MPKRYCMECGTDISDRPIHHFVCYDCWCAQFRTTSTSRTFSRGCSIWNDDDDDRYREYNDTYEQFYRGDSEYDLGPDWDYDEYPPENL